MDYIEFNVTRMTEKWQHHQNCIEERQRNLKFLRKKRYKPRTWGIFPAKPLDKRTYDDGREWCLYAIAEHRKAQKELMRLYMK